MGGIPAIIFLFAKFLLLPDLSFSLPLCTDSSEFISYYFLIWILFSYTLSILQLMLLSRWIFIWFLFFPELIGTGAPFTLNTTLSFCPYNGKTCCNSTEDLQVQKQFQVMNISDPGCASLLKSILCAVSLCFSDDTWICLCFCWILKPCIRWVLQYNRYIHTYIHTCPNAYLHWSDFFTHNPF